jgi:hypothetical protein
MSRQFHARGFIAKGVDLSSAAVTARLRTLAALSDMCRRLGTVGRGLNAAPRDDEPDRR